MCVGFVGLWSPYAVVSLWTAYGRKGEVPIRITLMSVLLAKLSTIVNPLVYFMLNKKFRPIVRKYITGISIKIQRGFALLAWSTLYHNIEITVMQCEMYLWYDLQFHSFYRCDIMYISKYGALSLWFSKCIYCIVAMETIFRIVKKNGYYPRPNKMKNKKDTLQFVSYIVTNRVSVGQNHPTSLTSSFQEDVDDTTRVQSTLYVRSYIFLNRTSTPLLTVQVNPKK